MLTVCCFAAGVSCRYGFVEYSTPEATTDAVAAMNKFDLGGQYVGLAISKSYIAPLFFKMAQNLDLRYVLVPAPWVLGPKHVLNPE